jgi:hypothetical protein
MNETYADWILSYVEWRNKREAEVPPAPYIPRDIIDPPIRKTIEYKEVPGVVDCYRSCHCGRMLYDVGKLMHPTCYAHGRQSKWGIVLNGKEVGHGPEAEA